MQLICASTCIVFLRDLISHIQTVPARLQLALDMASHLCSTWFHVVVSWYMDGGTGLMNLIRLLFMGF